jgi:hypothetical protein
MDLTQQIVEFPALEIAIVAQYKKTESVLAVTVLFYSSQINVFLHV